MSESTAGNRFSAADIAPVAGLDPVDGWTLFAGDYEDSSGFHSPFYVARGRDSDVLLNVSRFAFTPTQERFAFLVGFGFPRDVIYSTGVRGPLCDRSIDCAIERRGERRAAA